MWWTHAVASNALRLAAMAVLAGLAVSAGAARIGARPTTVDDAIHLKGVEAVAHGYQARISLSDGASPPTGLILSAPDGAVCQTVEFSGSSAETTALFPARDCSEPLRPGSPLRLTGRLGDEPFSLAAAMTER